MILPILLVLLLAGLSAQQPPIQYYLTGNPADVRTAIKPGILLAGGGRDVEAAFRWFLDRSGGGDIVILRSTGTDGYHQFLRRIAPVDSVESFVLRSRDASSDPKLLTALRGAEAIFLAGGDQWNYVRYWKDTPIEDAIHAAVRRGVPVGGTSAGLAVLGEFVFSARFDTVTSPVALADPFHQKVAITTDFLMLPEMACTITDSHFTQRRREGRLLVWLGRIRQESRCREVRGIGIDERTAVILEPNGKARVVGENAAYLYRLRERPDLRRGKPAELPPITSLRVPAGNPIDWKRWRGGPEETLTLNVRSGEIQTPAARPHGIR